MRPTQRQPGHGGDTGMAKSWRCMTWCLFVSRGCKTPNHPIDPFPVSHFVGRLVQTALQPPASHFSSDCSRGPHMAPGGLRTRPQASQRTNGRPVRTYICIWPPPEPTMVRTLTMIRTPHLGPNGVWHGPSSYCIFRATLRIVRDKGECAHSNHRADRLHS